MANDAFLITERNSLSQLRKAPYESEDLLQRLLADHPILLKDIGGSAGRLLLIRREAPIADTEGGSGRWSLDHLFVDGDGVPVLVEVKRASDTRLRREVVGQMMDYAANGVAYWPIETLVEACAATVRAAGEDIDATMAAFLGGGDVEAFWRQVEANLRSGRVRLVFIADLIPRELRRIVEFLNEQMRPAEVLALEIDQYVTGDGQRMLMPKLVGKTERAVTAKSVSPPTPEISVEEWLTTLREKWGASAEETARQVLRWGASHGLNASVTSTGDAIALSFVPPGGKSIWPFFIRRSNAKLETSLQYLQYSPAFTDDASRNALLNRFRSIPGVTISTTKATGWPAVSLADAGKPGVWEAWSAIAADIITALVG